ncbi:MAG: type II toxin-antitoxin system HigB family toxin [Cyanobacteria bacterium P01_D01_bin.36]
MRFIKKSNLEKDLKGLPNGVRKSAINWLDVVENKKTIWHNFVDVRNTYATVSQVGELYVFNIKDHRLIVGISFLRRIIYYKAILSHSDYDKGLWKTQFHRQR